MGTFPGRVVRRTMDDDVPSQAVLIAWSALQTIFPIALALAAILGVVLRSIGMDSSAVLETVAALVPDPAARAQVLEALQLVTTQTGLFAVLAGASVISSSLLPLLASLPGLSSVRLTQPPQSFFTQFAVGSVAGFLLFFAIYYVVPNRRQRPAEVWPGALFAGVGFEILTLAFPIYLSLAGHGMNQYGKTFALLFILMAFFYFVGLLTLVGLEINAVLHPTPGPVPVPVPQAPHSARRRRGLRRVLYGLVG